MNFNHVHQNNHNLLNFSDEIKIAIFSYLSEGDLAHRVSLVCKDFHRLMGEESLWKKKALQQATWSVLKTWKQTKLNTLIAKKQQDDSLQQRITSAANSLLGLNVDSQAHYYPAQSNTVVLNGKVRKITVRKPC